jgi:hypothetical protein
LAVEDETANVCAAGRVHALRTGQDRSRRVSPTRPSGLRRSR